MEETVMNEGVKKELCDVFVRDGLTEEMAAWLASKEGQASRKEFIQMTEYRMNLPKVFRLPCGAIPGHCRICDKRSKAAPTVSLL